MTVSASYVIEYIWPSGKLRYRTDLGLVKDKDDAACYTLIEAARHVRNSDDARIVWDIRTRKIRV
jgi:hypothetical protein